MNHSQSLICGALGFLLTWLLIPLIIKRAIWLGGISHREFHQTHANPIPRFGGVALVLAFLGVSWAAYLWSVEPVGLRLNGGIVLSATAMFLLGLLDDIRPVRARYKLVMQIIIAISVYSCGVGIEMFKNPFTNELYQLHFWSLPVTVFWIVAMTNLINLVDGIDGLAGGIGFMLMCLLAYVGLQVSVNFSILLAVGMAGALLGFLYFNFPPARIYMGDGGAYLIGFLIAVLAIQNSYKGTVAVAIIAPVFALALPIADVGLAILRRGLKGLPIFRADKRHIHHRLARIGFSPTTTVMILYAVSLVFLLFGFSLIWSNNRLIPILVAVSLMMLVALVRSIGLIQDWLAVRNVMSSTIQVRREARYALTLGQWFEMEAERCRSAEELWKNYQFLCEKLRFHKVQLHLPDEDGVWQSAGPAPIADHLLHDRHEVDLTHKMSLDFWGDKQVLPTKLFFLMSELASEAWLRGARRWQTLHHSPLLLRAPASAASSETVQGTEQPLTARS